MTFLRSLPEDATLLRDCGPNAVHSGIYLATSRGYDEAEGVNLEEVERQLLVQALERSHGNQTHAGQMLGINRDQVRYRIEKFHLQIGQERV